MSDTERASPAALPEAFLARVAAEFPADFLSRDPADLLHYGRDWTRFFPPAPSAIAFPRETDEVARLVKLCNEFAVPIVPSGGRTGLAAGAVAHRGELVVSLAKMNRMEPVDPLAHAVRVQAGAVTQAGHEHCAAAGLFWPIDLASKGSSQVGGNIATNAGGVKVIRYGLTRNWVLGLQVVTGTGDILELNGALEKNNTGYDLRQLFIGSEGTLGIITEATLRLCRAPGNLDVFLFAVQDLAGVLSLFRDARRGPFVISAYEFFTANCLSRVVAHRGLRSPFLPGEAGCYVLMEVERPVQFEILVEWLGDAVEEQRVLDGVLAQNPREAHELWALREGISETLAATEVPHKNDVTLPVSELWAFCDELTAFFAMYYPGWEICNFGHIGDGNLHINVLKPPNMTVEEFHQRTNSVDHALFRLVHKHGGSISAEHGIGLLKKEYLPYSRTAAEMTIFRSVKRALDPNGIMNPGKVFDL